MQLLKAFRYLPLKGWSTCSIRYAAPCYDIPFPKCGIQWEVLKKLLWELETKASLFGRQMQLLYSPSSIDPPSADQCSSFRDVTLRQLCAVLEKSSAKFGKHRSIRLTSTVLWSARQATSVLIRSRKIKSRMAFIHESRIGFQFNTSNLRLIRCLFETSAPEAPLESRRIVRSSS